MNGSDNENRWWRVLDGVFGSLDVIDLALEVISLIGHAIGVVLSSLLEILSGF
jgi:hypothetical protein